MTPLVSVIIPHLNRADLLRAAIDSVLRSDASAEIVVVDDGSSASEWDRIVAYATGNVEVTKRSGGNPGPSRCRNLGVHACRGEYVIFLDSDDLMAPWCISQRLKLAAASPVDDLWVFPVLLFRDTPADDPRLWNTMTSGTTSLSRFASGDAPWHTSSPLWRKTSFLSIGGFNERVLYGDDSDLHLRALASGLKAHEFPDALPDAFVRRSDAPRITSSLNASLVESRRTRLAEGFAFLSGKGEDRLIRLWEAQYFVEAEFLLFNNDGDTFAIDRILTDWERSFHPRVLLRRAVRAYFSIGCACRNRAYLVLRAARRLAMMFFPPAYFPFAGNAPHPMTTDATMNTVRQQIGNA